MSGPTSRKSRLPASSLWMPRAVPVGAPLRPGAGAWRWRSIWIPPPVKPLVVNLIVHAPMVLFSAAPPGQGGEHHVNERTYEFWRGLFARHGYACFDFLRPRLHSASGIEPWYRYNLLLFVREYSWACASAAVSAGARASRRPPR